MSTHPSAKPISMAELVEAQFRCPACGHQPMGGMVDESLCSHGGIFFTCLGCGIGIPRRFDDDPELSEISRERAEQFSAQQPPMTASGMIARRNAVLELIPDDWPVEPHTFPGPTTATCVACGMFWQSGDEPAQGVCPFEEFHEAVAHLR